MAAPHRDLSLFDFRCHFAFSFRPGVGLVLLSTDTIPNRLAIVNRQMQNSFNYLLSRKTGQKAHTQNTVISETGK
jgi:hypothetical protein